MIMAIELTERHTVEGNGLKARDSSAARFVAAIILALLMQVVVAGLTTAIESLLIARRGLPPLMPRPAPYILTVVAFAAAWCSLCAIWWAQTRLPSHVKTV